MRCFRIITNLGCLALLMGGMAGASRSTDAEIALALSAAPRNLQTQAGVWVRTPLGYRQARQGANGLQCLVVQETPATLEPQCYDRDSAATLLPVDVYRRERRMHGEKAAQIERDVASRYAKGSFTVPKPGDVVYMLSNDNRVLVSPQSGKVIHFPPHVMITAPFKTGSALGGGNKYAFIINEGGPGALIIITVAK